MLNPSDLPQLDLDAGLPAVGRDDAVTSVAGVIAGIVTGIIAGVTAEAAVE